MPKVHFINKKLRSRVDKERDYVSLNGCRFDSSEQPNFYFILGVLKYYLLTLLYYYKIVQNPQ